ncbi:MAG: murein transglycosylase [Deltaproteobacteria bacterium]|nr:murein transglycosylase [Deltaproteobacteria bacterium]
MKHVKKIAALYTLLLILLTLPGCFPPLKNKALAPEEALSRMRFFYPAFRDDMDTDSLMTATEKSIAYLNRISPEKIFHYGAHRFTSRQVLESQQMFLKLISDNPGPDKLNRRIRKHFRVYRATGRVGNKKVLFTGYFEPLYHGSRTRDETFKYPLYGKPADMLKIDLSLFRADLKGKSIIARIEDKKVLPYYSKYHIDGKKALKGRNLEIAWLKDPLDVAFLHIQGSGRLLLPDGKSIRVGYRSSNGRPYRSIGRYMLDRGFLNKAEMSMQSIRRYLTDHPEIVDEVLNHNPSYVFFRVLESEPVGNIGVPLTPGRSVALDYRLFPKGALAFVSCRKPIVDNQGRITTWIKFSRFVLNQDTGGAIRGAGRADLFWGSGPYAEVAAGHMRHEGELYILIKKP